MDFALIAQAATLESRIPFLHFFDGFRTSHEVAKVEPLADDDLRAMIDERSGARPPRPRAVARPPGHPRHRAEPRRLLPGARDGQPVLPRPARPSCRTRWTSSPRSPAASTTCSTTSARPTPSASIVLMGSGAETAQETVESLNARGREGRRAQGPALPAVLRSSTSLAALPPTVARRRRARPHQGAGRVGEPLYLDVVTALSEAVASGAARRDAPGHRRPLRALVQGIHARPWSRPSSTSWPQRGPGTTSPSASTTT